MTKIVLTKNSKRMYLELPCAIPAFGDDGDDEQEKTTILDSKYPQYLLEQIEDVEDLNGAIAELEAMNAFRSNMVITYAQTKGVGLLEALKVLRKEV